MKLLPKKSKRCKGCKKFIVQVEDYSKKLTQKFELCHLFINQLPYCTISKVDFFQKVLYLKFVIFDYKEAKISFTPSEESDYEIIIPDSKYEVADTSLGETGEYLLNNTDPYIISKGDRCIVLKFRWGERRIKNITDYKGTEVETLNKLEINDDILNQDQVNKSQDNIILKFTTHAEFFRLENQTIVYDYEIKLSQAKSQLILA